jgi:hypothetical protein
MHTKMNVTDIDQTDASVVGPQAPPASVGGDYVRTPRPKFIEGDEVMRDLADQGECG